MEYTDSEVDEYISEVLAETQWDKTQLTLPEFLVGFSAAQPVRLVPQAGESTTLGAADLLHPFLAFSRRRRTKAYAENLVWNQKEKKYCANGPPLEIPKDYIGWLEVIPPGGQKNMSCKTTIGEVLRTKCKQFLVRSTVVGHLPGDGPAESGDLKLGEEVRVYPGEILNVGDVLTKQWKMQSVGDSDKSNKKKKDPVAETKFLHCVDAKDRDLYLPLAHPGKFYGLYDSSMKSKTPRTDVAYYIYDLFHYGFPLLVNVVFGWPPADFDDFSGFMRILGLNRPDSVIFRSMKPQASVIMELPLNSDIRVEKMSNPEILSSNRPFERILGHSCDRIYPYLIGMKHMDAKYPVLVSETPDDKKDVTTASVCRMARPRNMNKFNPLDVFPPLDEPVRRVADSWTLSFKDPDFSAIGHSDLRVSESVAPPGEDGRGQLTKQQSVVGGVQDALEGVRISADRSGPPGRRDPLWHQRHSNMEQGLLDREADC